MPSALPSSLAAEFEAISRDNRSGAMALLRRATEATLQASMGLDSPALIELAASTIEAAQPSMATMIHLANRLRATANAPSLPESVAQACQELLAYIDSSSATIVRNALTLFGRSEVVFTHSFSDTVVTVLEAAHQHGKLARVICTESRPMCEGTQMARRLATKGVPVDLVVDAAAARVVGEAGLVLVGADSVSPEGLVNKIGTHLIALAATEHGIRVYAVASSLKMVLTPPATDKPQAASEITEEISGCRVRNYYFETTPVGLLTGVVTENGLKSYRGW